MNSFTLTAIMNENYFIQKCCEDIEKKLNWGPREKWTNSNYIQLHEIIFESTQVNVSSNTLKRVFGKVKTTSSYYNPQEATKNALSLFLGYESWLDYIEKNQPGRSKSTTDGDIVIHENNQSPQKILYSIIIILFTVLCGSLYYILIYENKSEEEVKLDYFEFYCDKPFDDKLPHEVTFHVDISKLNQEKANFLLKGEGTLTMVKNLEKEVIKHAYYKYGFRNAKLYSNNNLKLV